MGNSQTPSTFRDRVRPPRPRAFTGGGPWRPGNRFHLVAVSEEYFTRMLAAIISAQRYVLLEMYLVESGALTDRFAAELTAAAARGVKVYMVLDGFGALGLSGADRLRLSSGGVDLRFYNALSWRKKLHNFRRDHRKILVVDGRVAFVGGVGLTDEFSGDRNKGPPWRDQVVEIAGPVIADWEEAFWRTWQRCGGRAPPLVNDATAAEQEAKTLRETETEKEAEDRLGALGRVALSEAAPSSVIARDVVRRIASALTSCLRGGFAKRFVELHGVGSTSGCWCPARGRTIPGCGMRRGGSTERCFAAACASSSISRGCCTGR
jgi:phosphatidylserine/phosphatidylglycerophosphate/cardiolipin synthase-like enzyme